MDWGRAKTILILSFLALNLVLVYQLWMNRTQMEEAEIDQAEIAEEIRQLLSSHNIQLKVDVPELAPRLKEITVRFLIQTDPQHPIELEQPVTDNVILNKAGITDVLAEQIRQANAYDLDTLISKPGEYVLNQLYEGLPMFEVNLNLYYDQNEIHRYSQSFVEVEKSSESDEQKVLPAMMAIGNLAENYLPDGTIITHISLGYHGQIYNSETQVLAPFWRVATESGDIYYIHAITGAVETPQKDSR